jgi:hypothetical protein
MAQKRAAPWYKEADRQYPIRVRLRLPELSLYKLGIDLDGWLEGNLGSKMWNWGPAGWSGHGHQATYYYFRRIEDAQRFVAAFPQLELADEVAAPIDATPIAPTPFEGGFRPISTPD